MRVPSSCALLFPLFLLLLSGCEGNGISYRERATQENGVLVPIPTTSPLTLVALSDDGAYLTVEWKVQSEIDYLVLSLVGDSSGDSSSDEQLAQFLLPALYRRYQMALPQDYAPSQLRIQLEAYPADGGSPLLVTQLLQAIEPSSDLLLPEDYLQSLERSPKSIDTESTADIVR